MQASHYAIAAHRLVVLAEVNAVTQDWGYFLFKLSLTEALEEVATRVAEEAWLYNEYAFNICFDYIHCCYSFVFYSNCCELYVAHGSRGGHGRGA